MKNKELLTENDAVQYCGELKFQVYYDPKGEYAIKVNPEDYDRINNYMSDAVCIELCKNYISSYLSNNESNLEENIKTSLKNGYEFLHIAQANILAHAHEKLKTAQHLKKLKIDIIKELPKHLKNGN